MIDSRQLRYFAAVAEHLHFAKAADTLHVAQSALSAQVRKLEEHLGVRLLNRDKRAAVSLTEAGQLFVVEVHQALRQIERAEQVGKLAARGQLGRVDLGYIASAAINGLLPSLLEKFRRLHPMVDVNLVPLDTPAQLRSLADGQIDVGIVRPRPGYPDGVDGLVMLREPLLLVLPESNPLARSKALDARSLATERFIVPQFDGDAGFVEPLAELAQKAGADLQPVIKVPDFVSALALSAAGYGLVLAPACFQRVGIEGVIFRTIDDFDLQAEMTCVWRKSGHSRAADALVEVIRSMASETNLH